MLRTKGLTDVSNAEVSPELDEEEGATGVQHGGLQEQEMQKLSLTLHAGNGNIMQGAGMYASHPASSDYEDAIGASGDDDDDSDESHGDEKDVDHRFR